MQNLPLRLTLSNPSPMIQLHLETGNLEPPPEFLSRHISIPSPTFVNKRLTVINSPTSQTPNSLTSLTGTPRVLKSRNRGHSRFKQTHSIAPFDSDGPAVNVLLNETPEERIRKILSSPKRSNEDAVYIYKQLQDFDFFKKFKESNTSLHEIDSLIHICKHLGYEKHKAGSIIMKEGDQPNRRLYLILTGEVSIIVRQLDHVTQKNLKGKNINELNVADPDISIPRATPIDLSDDHIKGDNSKDGFSRIFSRQQLFGEEERFSIFEKKDFFSDKDNPALSKAAKLWRKVLSVVRLTVISRRFRTSIVLSQAPNPENKEFWSSIHDLNKVGSNRNSPSRMDTKTLHLPVDKGICKSKNSITSIDLGGRELESPRSPQKNLRVSPTNEVRKSSFMLMSPLKIILPPEEDKVDIDKIASKYGNIINKIGRGTFFGEKALYSKQKRSATILTNVDCEFLTVSEELFRYVKSRFEKTNTKKLNFLLDNFPAIEKTKNRSFLENLLYLLEEQTFELHSGLTVEGVKAKSFYILFEGVCNVYKKLPKDEPGISKLRQYGDQEGSNKSDGILVCQIFPGTFIGEEVVFNNNNQYEFTVRAASSTVVAMAIDRASFAVRFPNHVFFGLKRMYQKKSKHYLAMGMERAKMKSEIIHLARMPRKKKVNLNPNDIEQNRVPNILLAAKGLYKGEKGEDSEDLAQFANRAIVYTSFSHKLPPPELVQKEAVSYPEISNVGISVSPIDHRHYFGTPGLKSIEAKVGKFIQGLNTMKFDFGEQEIELLDDKKIGSARKPITPKGPGIKALNLISIKKIKNPSLVKTRADDDTDILGNQLLKRIQKSRQKSKRFNNAASSATKGCSTAIPSPCKPAATYRGKSEPFVSYEKQHMAISSADDSPRHISETFTIRVKTKNLSTKLCSTIESEQARDMKVKEDGDLRTLSSYFNKRKDREKLMLKLGDNVFTPSTDDNRFGTDRSMENGMMGIQTLRTTTAPDTPLGRGYLRKMHLSLAQVSLEAGFFSGLPNIDMQTPSASSWRK